MGTFPMDASDERQMGPAGSDVIPPAGYVRLAADAERRA
jgi:hypothetical protein